jgi:phosphatidylglycerophosphatase C
MDERVLEFWDKHEHNVFEYYFLQKHPTDVIISASPEFMLKPICDKWGVNLIASIVDKNRLFKRELFWQRKGASI